MMSFPMGKQAICYFIYWFVVMQGLISFVITQLQFDQSTYLIHESSFEVILCLLRSG